MPGIYRKFNISPITSANYDTFLTALRQLDTRGIASWTAEHDPSTNTLTLAVGIDTEALPNGVTAADLRTRIRNFFQTRFGRLPDVDVARVAGEDLTTGRDMTRAMISAWDNNTDPALIGIHGPTLQERRQRLFLTMTASRSAWGI